MFKHQWSTNVRNREIILELTELDEGLHLLLVGGDCSHIGAISMTEKNNILKTMSFESHKEYYITEQWATKWQQTIGCPVTLAAGVHYDHATKEEIQMILDAINLLMERALKEMKGRYYDAIL